jgi:hypothetical protein
MSEVRNAIRTTALEPDTLQMFGEIFDQVWARVSAEFEGYDRIEDERIRLATIILELGEDGQLGRRQITATASSLIREARRHDNDS